MRPRTNVMSLMALAAISALPSGNRPGTAFGLQNGSRRRDGERSTSPRNPETDLVRAEEQLAAARTPGARRKAARKVEAIRAQLHSLTPEEPRHD